MTGPWFLAGILMLVAALAVVAWGVFHPRARLFGKVRTRLPEHARREGCVALTFDDGPLPGGTDRVLDVLAERGVRATFFVIGAHARAHPELLERIAREGHTIGNHTYDHHRHGLLYYRRYWRDQIRRTQAVIEEITGQSPGLFRPPMGFTSPPLMHAARAEGLEVVAWTRRSYDAGIGRRGAILRAARRLRAGEILLLHDGKEPASGRVIGLTADTLTEVLDILHSRGLKPVPLDAI